MKRLLVVSHPCVVGENQSAYLALEELGWLPTIVVPARWRHAFSPEVVRPETLEGLEGRLVPLRVLRPGRPQRHVYLARPAVVLRRVRPDFVFIEQEPFALATLQWGIAAQRAGIPFGVQAAENLDRDYPLPARAIRHWTLRHAAFIAARSARAGELVRMQGAVGDVELVPHGVPNWSPPSHVEHDRFTVGFAGRLVPEKGVLDLVEAMRRLGRHARLILAGDGPLADELASLEIPDVEIKLMRDIGHAGMPEAYARMDLLVLPSCTTPRWSEQFGRVLVEALACGVPVVGSDSGEIPWVIEQTGGGRVFPEGNAEALAKVIRELMDAEPLRRSFAETGRAAVSDRFTVTASARALDRLLESAVPGGRPRAHRKPVVTVVAHGIHDGGGMERAFTELIRRGHDRYEFNVISAELAEELRPLVRWWQVRVPMRPVSLKTPLFFVLAGVKLARTRSGIVHTLGAIVPNRADVVTVQFCHAGHLERAGRLAPRDAPRLRRANTTLARGFALAAERWCYRPGRTRALAAVSDGVADELRRHYQGLPVIRTPNGVDLERFRPDAQAREETRRQYGVAADELVVVFVGGDWDRKGLAPVIEGVALAQRGYRGRFRLWVVGNGDRHRFAGIAEGFGIGDAVTFLGTQSAVEKFLQAADIFVVLSLYETFSLAAHEAAASGLPVISTHVNGIDELLAGGDAGMLVERTGTAVAAAIQQLAGNDELRAALGVAARRRVEGMTWEASVAAVTAFYEWIGQPPSDPLPARAVPENVASP